MAGKRRIKDNTLVPENDVLPVVGKHCAGVEIPGHHAPPSSDFMMPTYHR
jgi:hypothetical protein